MLRLSERWVLQFDTEWRYGCVVSTFFSAGFFACRIFFSYYLQLDRFVLCRSLTLVGGYFLV